VIRRDRRILEGAVIGGEEIDLEILRGLVMNAFAVDGDAQSKTPLYDRKYGFEAFDPGTDRRPSLLGCDTIAKAEVRQNGVFTE
jgi:hypothetical protein